MRQFRHFGIHQRSQCVQVLMGGTAQGKLAQYFQTATDTVAHRHIRFQKGLVTGQQIAPLTGLGIFQCRQQITRALYDNAGMRSLLGCFPDLSERPER